MACSNAGIFGWDLLYKSVESEIKTKDDILVCLTHLILISKGFRCVGIGESKVLEGDEPKFENLPKGWNEEYAIRYVYQGRLYNLKGTVLDDGITINLLRVDERNVSTVQLNSRFVVNITGPLEQMIPELEALVNTIKNELIETVTTSIKSKNKECQTNLPVNTPINSSPSARSMSVPYRPCPFLPLNVGVGVSDLHPFGMNPLGVPGPPHLLPGGGGMLYTPPQGYGRIDPGGNLGVPRGSLPPGARFDPFRPPDIGRVPRRPNNNPDNDELPPPGFDDMFM